MKLLFLIYSVLLLNSCVGNLGKTLTEQTKSGDFSYNLSEGGCSTGDHTFYSLESMCDGLKNESINNNCAGGLRFLKFQSDCLGRSW